EQDAAHRCFPSVAWGCGVPVYGEDQARLPPRRPRIAARTPAEKPAILISGPPTVAAKRETREDTFAVVSSTLVVIWSRRASCLFASLIVVVVSSSRGAMPVLASLMASLAESNTRPSFTM